MEAEKNNTLILETEKLQASNPNQHRKPSQRQQRLQEVSAQLEQGVREVFSSEKYQHYLKTMAKFHRYSFRNSLLIAMQKPDASYVASFTAWRTKFHRTVNKGEQGIKILCPMTFKKNKNDQNTNAEIADEKDESITTYRVGYTFDISQTSGEPLPEIVTNLNFEVNGYDDLLNAIKRSIPDGFRVKFLSNREFRNENIRGFTDSCEKLIAVRSGMDQAQTIKTLLHEITHAQLHVPELDMPMDQRTDRRTHEVQAESTAFVVCNKYGIDTSEYTFPYVASWSSDKDLKELQNSLETIQKTSSELIDKIDSKLLEMNPEKYADILKGFEALTKIADRPKAPSARGR